MFKKSTLLRLEMRLMKLREAENDPMLRAIAGLRRCNLNCRFRHGISHRSRPLHAEQSYEESSNKKSSKRKASFQKAVNGKVGCWCPPGFCRCRIKTPIHDDPNRGLSPMFPCKCPPGFVCRCLRIQHIDEDAQSFDESVGSCSPNSLSDQWDEWNQNNEEKINPYVGAQRRDHFSSGILPMPTEISDAYHHCLCPPGFCRCRSSHIFSSCS